MRFAVAPRTGHGCCGCSGAHGRIRVHFAVASRTGHGCCGCSGAHGRIRVRFAVAPRTGHGCCGCSGAVLSDRMELDGKIAIVTGASRGVGAATAVALAAHGCAVACAARATDANPLPLPGTVDETVRRITDAGGTAIAVPTNLANDAEIERMVATTVEQLGPVDILVNNAAITFPGDVELPMKRFDLIFAVDLRAPLIAIQAVLPSMRERRRGSIVNVSSLAALNYFPGLMAYGMAKAAMEHMTLDLAVQLRPDGIAVNTFRIDVPVASEGFVANLPGEHPDWEPPEVAAEGILWMIERPESYTGHNDGMARLRADHGIMASRASRPHTQSAVVTETHLRPPA